MTALAYLINLLTSLPGLIAAGINVKQLLDEHRAVLQGIQAQGRDPTPEEWANLDNRIKALQATLHAS